MIPKLPAGSKIAVKPEGSETVITIPHVDNRLARYGISLFLLVWLGGWSAGMWSALDNVFSGSAHPLLFFWLAGWSAGGAFVLYWRIDLARGASEIEGEWLHELLVQRYALALPQPSTQP